MFCSLLDNLLHNEMFRNMPTQKLNEIRALFYHNNHKEKWDSRRIRNLVCEIAIDLCDGKEYTIDDLKQKSKVNLRGNLNNQDWKRIWKTIKTDKLWTFSKAFLDEFPDGGEVANNCIDMLLGVLAHHLKSNILVFDGPTNTLQFINGNAFLNGNVTNYVPFLVGHTQGHYQVLVPDVKKVPNAKQIILDYCLHESDQCQIDQAKEYSRMDTLSLVPSSSVTKESRRPDVDVPVSHTENVPDNDFDNPQPGPSTANIPSKGTFFILLLFKIEFNSL